MTGQRPGRPDWLGARRAVALGARLALVVAGSAAAAGSDPTPWFRDVSSEVGLNFTQARALEIRLWLPEIMSGGAAWLDADGDGRLDLYLVQGGDLDAAARGEAPAFDAPGNVLLRNGGERFEDVTVASGTGHRGYGMGAAAADYDGDGDTDLYLTNLGPNVLFRNEGGGRFTDVTARSGTGHEGWGTSAAWLDYDRDGDLDLFVANYVAWDAVQEQRCFNGSAVQNYCHPRQYDAPAPDVLYRNDGDGRFTDVTEAAGLLGAFGHGLGVAIADLDGDGLVDLYVANDGMPNQLWRNRGEGTFEDLGLLSGTAVNMVGKAEAGMGVAAVDADDDGDFDLFMSHLRSETNTYYRNDGRGLFRDVTPTAGLAAASLPYTGFGLGFADFDLDGILDLYVANGRVTLSSSLLVVDRPYAEPNQLYRGLGGGRFALLDDAETTATPDIENSRAAAFGDYDDDGDVDVLVVNNGGPARLLRNEAPRRGHWLGFRTIEGAADAIGAVVTVRTGDGTLRYRQVQPAYSYQASNDPRVHFGLAEATGAVTVIVRWADGRRERFSVSGLDRYHRLTRGSGQSCSDQADCLAGK